MNSVPIFNTSASEAASNSTTRPIITFRKSMTKRPVNAEPAINTSKPASPDHR
jgi:hypothetical protein